MKQGSFPSQILRAFFFGGVLATATALIPTRPADSRTDGIAFKDSPKVVLDEAWQLVNQYYVDNTFNRNDWQAIRKDLLSPSYSSKDQAYSALRSALKKLQDPYTRFMDPEQFTALTTQTSGELSGVGIRLELNKVTKILTVVEPMAGSPALKAGIKAGDQILAIDGKSTRTMNVEAASALIRGKVGTTVKLRINRGGTQNFDVAIGRQLIELSTVTYSVKKEANANIGYIRLGEFSSHAASQIQKAIRELDKQQVNAYILDLRGNPGGLLNASIDIARMWLNKGTIVRTVDRVGQDDSILANQTAMTQLPLVVLVDGNSASSSEILTGALKDNGRATVVGTKTFGKALVQSVHQLSDGSGMAVTIAHYYTPNGTDISHKGIIPDIQADLTAEQVAQLNAKPDLLATKADPQYMQAVRSATKLIRAYRPDVRPNVTVTGVEVVPPARAAR
ncbi:carboxyl-terminal processing protease CtpB [Altericista sp. CCNU0014]|uniref:carboxyl-terminal processing protease CtpB n=1 Tax=Altericista sp. CCNU0014 TaxID=3082949 RepID=UPI00384D15A9